MLLWLMAFMLPIQKLSNPVSVIQKLSPAYYTGHQFSVDSTLPSPPYSVPTEFNPVEHDP